MRPTQQTEVAVVGGGILGLAHALEASRQGRRVTVFEKDAQARGASVRNFGMVYPIGMKPGLIRERALRSRRVWLELGAQAGFWHDPVGSLLVARTPDELQVLEEFVTHSAPEGYTTQMLSAEEALQKSPGLVREGLLGALWSDQEVCVDPVEALQKIPAWLQAQYQVEFCYQTTVTHVESGRLRAGGTDWQAEQIIVCSGADLQTLFPKELAESGIQNCQLHMFRTVPQSGNWRLGPLLAAGLTLLHYPAFALAPSLPQLRQRLQADFAPLLEWGIHVLASQHGHGQVTLGDSHEYGPSPSLFYRMEIEERITEYLQGFLALPSLQIAERWLGVYPRHPSGEPWIHRPSPGVLLVNGIGGIGMTTSFGLVQETLKL